MSTLIIDQFKEILKKIKSIKGWHREGEEDKENKNIPNVPIILNFRPGTITDNNQIANNEIPSNVNHNVMMWTKATAETKPDVKDKTSKFRKLASFMRRNRRAKARGA